MNKKIQTRLSENAFKKDRFGYLSFAAFIAITIMLFSVSVLLFSNLTGAIDHLMESAECADFLQMHSGEYDEKLLQQFADERPDVESWQVQPFLNLDNNSLIINNFQMNGCTQDNGLCVQSEKFDFLLDMDGGIPYPRAGEIYVPIFYKAQCEASTGDIISYKGNKFKIAGFVRDSQMNSAMASSKRFVVNESDYEAILPLGSEEYLIEFDLMRGANISDFQKAYEDGGLPLNGPTITRSLIKMMNALSDGIMIFVILMVSVLVLIISLISIRFMLLTKLETERKEIGTLKAIGVAGEDIKSIYLNRYRVLVGAGLVVGLGLAIAIFQPLSSQMKLMYGVSDGYMKAFAITVVCSIALALIVMGFIRRVLKITGKMTAMDALRGSIPKSKNRLNSFSVVLVITLGMILMVIPVNIYNTMASNHFVTYMGVGESDCRIDIRQVEDIKTVELSLAKKLSEDKSVESFSLYETSSCKTRLSNGEQLNLLVESGDHNIFPVEYYKGCAPVGEKEIALSYLLANSIELAVGDEIELQVNDNYEKYTVCGIYSDITNGGKTAKVFSDRLGEKDELMWCIAYIDLAEGLSGTEWAKQYQTDKTEAMEIASYVKATYGSTIAQMKKASLLIKLVSVTIMALMIILLMNLQVQREAMDISTKKALGFSNKEIKDEYMKSIMKSVVFGMITGLLAGNLLGEKICQIALKQMGAVGFGFEYNWLELIIVIPLIAVITGYVSGKAGTGKINEIKAVQCLRGRE